MDQQLRSLQIGISWATSGAGGSGRVFADLVQHLPAAGIGVIGAVSAPTDASARTGGVVTSFAADGASMVRRLRGARTLISDLIVREHPDLIASHFALYTAPALDRLRKIPLIVHFHGPWAAESKQEGAGALSVALKRQLERAVYTRAVRVIVLSKAFARIAIEDYGVAESRIRLVPGAVDIARFDLGKTRAEARQALGWPADKRIFVAVRRLVSRMGLDRLIEAMKPVVAAHPDIVLYVIGKGRLRAELQQQIDTLGLSQHVRLLGFVPDEQLAQAYRAADLNVVPTVALEGFGLIAVEALAAGTPSIVTPVGGLPEIVAPLSADLVFASSSREDIASGLLRVADGVVPMPDAEACRAFAAQHFTAERMARDIAAVYREAVAG